MYIPAHLTSLSVESLHSVACNNFYHPAGVALSNNGKCAAMTQELDASRGLTQPSSLGAVFSLRCSGLHGKAAGDWSVSAGTSWARLSTWAGWRAVWTCWAALCSAAPTGSLHLPAGKAHEPEAQSVRATGRAAASQTGSDRLDRLSCSHVSYHMPRTNQGAGGHNIYRAAPASDGGSSKAYV